MSSGCMCGKRSRKTFNLTIEFSFFIPLTLHTFSFIFAKNTEADYEKSRAMTDAAASKVIRFKIRSIVIPTQSRRPESSIYGWFSIFAKKMSGHRFPPV